MRFLLLILFIPLFSGCGDDLDTTIEVIPDFKAGEGMFVLNEGNFGWGQATLGYYDFVEGRYYDKLFELSNGRPLGNVGQHLCLHDGLLYIVVNNSGKVEIADPTIQLKSVGQISGLISPRFFLPVDEQAAFVSDLYGDAVQVVSLVTNQVTGAISMPGWTEEMLDIGTQVLVTCRESHYLYVVDKEKLAVTDSIEVGYGSSELELDHFGDIWVLCYGDEIGTEKAKIVKIGGMTMAIEWSYELENGIKIQDISLDYEGLNLYVSAGHIFRIPVQSPAFIKFEGPEAANWYALGQAAGLGGIFCVDAGDYVSRGKVSYWPALNNKEWQFEAGIIPTQLLGY